MVLVFYPYGKCSEAKKYHLVEDDSFNCTSITNVKAVCGRSVNARTSFRDIADIIKEGKLCKHCHESYKAEIKAERA